MPQEVLVPPSKVENNKNKDIFQVSFLWGGGVGFDFLDIMKDSAMKTTNKKVLSLNQLATSVLTMIMIIIIFTNLNCLDYLQ